VSEKDFWFLDQEKLSQAFEHKGYPDVRDSPRPTGVRMVDADSINNFLESMHPYQVTVDELRTLLKAKLPATKWDGIAELVPSLCVDFDRRKLLSLYNDTG
jgi:hypothetical protein